MKKVFIEPQMKKIELNLKENIASSSDEKISFVFTTFFAAKCVVEDTTIKVSEFESIPNPEIVFANCYSYVASSMRYKGVNYVIREDRVGY